MRTMAAPMRIPFLRPRPSATYGAMGMAQKAPIDWMALKRPRSFAVGLWKNSFQCVTDWRPFIIEPSKPFAYDVIRGITSSKLSLTM